ncbi:MAG: hypothetical protein ACYSWO_01815 [Planctomycetota bacterium]|jgi:hypothetical protein
MQERNGIPKFDLAQQIMAEQRKNVSVRRKKPAGGAGPARRKTEAELVGRTIGLQPVSVGQDQVVADIVAKDIERLCRNSA